MRTHVVQPLLSGDTLISVMDLWREQGKESLLAISGISMWPLMRAGDRVRVRHAAGCIQNGDLIVFRTEHNLIAHRVVAIRTPSESTEYITMGDNSSRPDAPVEPRAVLGRIVGIERSGRFISLEADGWRRGGRMIALVSRLWLTVEPKLCGRARELAGTDQVWPFRRRLFHFIFRCLRSGMYWLLGFYRL